MFINERLLDCDGWSSTANITFNTTVIEKKNKAESRNQEWEYPLRRYTVEYPLLNKTLQKQVYGAFLVAKGMRHSFRYKDWTDYQVDSSFAYDGTGTTYQIGNIYTFGNQTVQDPIYLPNDGSVTITNPSGAILIEGVGYTVNYTTGIITLLNSPAVGTYAYTCTFDRKVRFNSDEVQIGSVVYIDGFIGTASNFELVEVRNDDLN